MAGVSVVPVLFFILIAMATLGQRYSVSADEELPPMPKPRLDGRIVGGMELDISDVPYQASLQRNNKHFCGGSIVDKNWILTAAHCTDGQSASYLSVRVGSSTHAGDGILLAVEKIVQHRQFNYSNIDYDFSMLKLAQTLSFSASVQPIKLARIIEKIPDGSMCLVTGWGNTKNATESRNNLRGAKVPIVNQKKCFEAYSKYGGVTPRMICAGYEIGGKDACQGDSGGPLVWKNKQIGIVSWGYGCAEPNYPGIYSRVSRASIWVRKVIAGKLT